MRLQRPRIAMWWWRGAWRGTHTKVGPIARFFFFSFCDSLTGGSPSTLGPVPATLTIFSSTQCSLPHGSTRVLPCCKLVQKASAAGMGAAPLQPQLQQRPRRQPPPYRAADGPSHHPPRPLSPRIQTAVAPRKRACAQCQKITAKYLHTSDHTPCRALSCSPCAMATVQRATGHTKERQTARIRADALRSQQRRGKVG